MRSINEIIIHCSASDFGDAETIRRWHTDPKPQGNGWRDIGYHYVILNGFPKSGQEYDPDSDGKVEFGRPVERQGAHCYGRNRNSIGICLIGNQLFSARQLYEALPSLLRKLMAEHGIRPENIRCHCEYDPGKTCPNIDVEMIRAAATAASGHKGKETGERFFAPTKRDKTLDSRSRTYGNDGVGKVRSVNKLARSAI